MVRVALGYVERVGILLVIQKKKEPGQVSNVKRNVIVSWSGNITWHLVNYG